MIIKCEKCKTKFVLDEKFIKTTGSNVRCSKCKNIFVTYPDIQDDTSLSIQKDGIKKKATPKIKEEVEKRKEEEDVEEEEIEKYEEVEDEEEDVEEEEIEEDDEEDIEEEEIEEDDEYEEEDIEEEEIEEDDEDEEEDIEEEIEEDDEVEEEEIIEKEENLDIGNNELVIETTIDELKKEKEVEIKKKKKKGLVLAILFTIVMISITTFSIYYLHNFLLKTDKKRINILKSAIDQNSNTIILKEKSVSDNVRSFFQKVVGKAENYPDIIPIPSTINSAQIINNKIGYIKLVTGSIVNKSNITYKVIKIKGTLSTNTNAKAREEVVVCGNMLSRQEIRNFSLAEIKKRIYDDKSSVATAPLMPGQRRNFLIIFYNLPNELTTYHINVISALPVK